MAHKTNGLTAVEANNMAILLDFAGVTRNLVNDLANRWFQPLTHVSVGGCPRESWIECQREKRETRGTYRLCMSQRVSQSVLGLFTAKQRAGKLRQQPPALPTNALEVRHG